MGDLAFLYLTHPRRGASLRRFASWTALLPEPALEGLLRLLPPLRLGLVPAIAGAGPGLVVGLPLTDDDLTRRSETARRKVDAALEGARRAGVRTVALGGRLTEPWWAALVARQGRVRVVTGEALAIVATVAGLAALAGPGLAGWRVGVAVGSGRRLAAETLAIWLARSVGRVTLFGARRDHLAGIAARVLGDSGLVVEIVGRTDDRPGHPGVRPDPAAVQFDRLDALCLLGAPPPGIARAVEEETVVVDLAPAPTAAAELTAAGRGLRLARGALIGVPWPGPCPARLARLFPTGAGPAGRAARFLPPAVAEAILEAGEDLGSGLAQPSLRRVERLAALARRHPLGLDGLRWLDTGRPEAPAGDRKLPRRQESGGRQRNQTNGSDDDGGRGPRAGVRLP